MKSMKNIPRFLAILIAWWTLLSSSAAMAYSVSPLRTVLSPFGPEAVERITINNNETQPITLSISALKVEVAEDGKVARTPAESDLQVFPPQVFLQPGKQQALQVRYTGSRDLVAGLYLVHISQVPITTTQGNAQIKVALEFDVAIVVQPKGAEPDLKVHEVFKDEESGALLMTVTNEGAGAGRFNRGVWTAQTPHGPVEIPNDALDTGETGYILPGSRRVVRVANEFASKLEQSSSVYFTPEAD